MPRPAASRRRAVAAGMLTIIAAVIVVTTILYVAGAWGDDPGGGAAPSSGSPEVVPSASDSEPATVPGTASPVAGTLTEQEAVAAARAAVPGSGGWEVRSAQSGALRDVLPAMSEIDWARDLPADLRVWVVYLVNPSGDEGSIVVLDATNGTVYGSMNGTAD